MDNEYAEIGDGMQFLTADCTPTSCNFQIRATPMDATCMCGALVGTTIETYFQLVEEAGYDEQMALIPLISAISNGFKGAGYTVNLDVDKDED